ncbi:NAD(P)H-dependent oxidoreductase [Pseudonocardia sp. MH-G8]|uniref:NAD(P)H-dependent oxidoreductase n=1 Tax=Pseudonocardia sp. MH-G8 TaxID=1854588 RepID=UPI000BA09B46|nr:NAD(P)H-dependent oxidoreductase [Pseudonocardia sp. MH-G8]OZM79896.1 NADPH:quinone reductase [Pseudonocardia sp. MH-G8]
MNVLWVFAHPEPRSLSGTLRADGERALRDLGHEVRTTDLYAMRWNPVVDRSDFTAEDGERLVVGDASERAHCGGTLSPDIRAQQDDLRWADAVVLQFPLWWYGMPAILKGWFDRVFVKGFAYGVRDPETHRTRRYGDGLLRGTRALAVVTAGAPEPSIGPRGLNGDIELLLFPLLHGTLFYTGMDALPPFVVAGADRMSEDGCTEASERLKERLRALPDAEPIAFRPQNGGDYDDDLVLRPQVMPGGSGLGVHVRA